MTELAEQLGTGLQSESKGITKLRGRRAGLLWKLVPVETSEGILFTPVPNFMGKVKNYFSRRFHKNPE